MNILASIKREEKQLEKQMSKLQHRLNGIRSAAQALGHSAAVELKGAKKRVLSAAGRAAIARRRRSGGRRLGSRRRRSLDNPISRLKELFQGLLPYEPEYRLSQTLCVVSASPSALSSPLSGLELLHS